MSKFTKILLAIATVWPFFYMILFFLFVLSFIFLGPRAGGEAPTAIFIIFPLHLLTMLLIMGLTVFYIVNVFRNERIEKDKKVLWALVLFMGNMIAMPIYWYLYIWPEEKPSHVGSTDDRRALNNPAASGWANHSASAGRDREYAPPPQPPNWRE